VGGDSQNGPKHIGWGWWWLKWAKTSEQSVATAKNGPKWMSCGWQQPKNAKKYGLEVVVAKMGQN